MSAFDNWQKKENEGRGGRIKGGREAANSVNIFSSFIEGNKLKNIKEKKNI